MNPAIEQLKKLASQKLNKGKVEALTKAHADAYAFYEARGQDMGDG